MRFYPKIALGPVTIDGLIVAEGEDIARTGVLRIEAGDYDLNSLRLVVNGSVWLPTSRGSNFLQYVVQFEGNFEVYSNYLRLLSFSNSVAADFPDFMNGVVRARIAASSAQSDSGVSESEERSESYYLNYHREVTSSYPYYFVLVGSDFTDVVDDYSVEGGTIEAFYQQAGFTRLYIRPSSDDSIVWLRYGELILFVAPV